MSNSKDFRRGPAAEPSDSPKPVLITGGAGFIGTNLAHRLLRAGQPVVLFDNLSRRGVEKNVEWLRAMHGELVQIEVADVRDAKALRRAAKRASSVFHFCAQVAVTTSLDDPVFDFEVNARGTLNLLEALRHLEEPIPVVFTSSNKVYGDLADVSLQIRGTRYEPIDREALKNGINEKRPLEFHSPYGCSKGAAGQYVLDYARTFGLPAVVFHMSCIYGLHQFGTEDQGWVAHFLIRALKREPITIYGDGRQVRDVLFVDDLVDAFLLTLGEIQSLSGQAFNIGGGPGHTLSLLELLDLIAELREEKPEVKFSDWRPADQQYYVSDIRKFSQATGWVPRMGVKQGVQRLYQWLMVTQDDPPRRPASDRFGGKRSLRGVENRLPAGARNGHSKSASPRGKGTWERSGEVPEIDLPQKVIL